MVASGICHSDEAIRKGDASLGYPVILGHEGAGIIEKVGSEVQNLKLGDHVVMAFYADGLCDKCLQGIPTQCRNYAKYNLSGTRSDSDDQFQENGKHISDMFNQLSFTTTTVTNQRNCVKVDKDADLRRVGPSRLELAKELGATDTINSKDEDPVKKIQGLTNGYGVDYAVDTTGLPAVMKPALDALAQGGTLVVIAVTPHDFTFSTWNDLCVGDKKVIGVNMGDAIPQIDVPRLIRFNKLGMFDYEKIEKFFDFEDINEANQASVSGKVIKPVLIIDKDYKPSE
ncbi:aryl-alcohol dehydrogenase [Lactobacillus amylovorus GRL 1112]|uniref:Aryl-alcohol dehydrogenase n=1 Tax=Lactobacillus amylovorus (strain GRL 1112) TaxID=695560 RepID=E4SI86_LACAR|nr:aryl-alcohol dehydrogenase [Lactobacillus amylovorus GRL 1112]